MWFWAVMKARRLVLGRGSRVGVCLAHEQYGVVRKSLNRCKVSKLGVDITWRSTDTRNAISGLIPETAVPVVVHEKGSRSVFCVGVCDPEVACRGKHTASSVLKLAMFADQRST